MKHAFSVIFILIFAVMLNPVLKAANVEWIKFTPPSAGQIQFKELNEGRYYKLFASAGEEHKDIYFESKKLKNKVVPANFIGASISGQLVTLIYRLKNGDTVELSNFGDSSFKGDAYFINICFNDKKNDQFIAVVNPNNKKLNINNWLPIESNVADFMFDYAASQEEPAEKK